MKSRYVFAIAIVYGLTPNIWAATFIPTSGPASWNVDANWDSFPAPFPNGSGAAAILSAPTTDLMITLGVPITVGSLTVNKATSGDFDTTISDTATLTFDGGSGILNGFSSVGTGLTIVAAPVVFNSTLTITQGDNDVLDFTQPLSGTGGLAVNRNAGTYSTVVALSAANIYSGATTTFTGSTADDFLVIRLNPASALPATTNVTLTQSAILELSGDNFTRAVGTAAGEIQFSGSGRNGWGAFGTDREVNLGGALVPATVTWGSGAGQANFGQLVLGVTTSNATVNFRNPLDIGSTGRNIRSYQGSAAIDGKMSGSITGTGSITKIGDGVLSFAAANSYTGNTIVQGGMLRLDDPAALGTGNLQLGSGAVLAIGADTTPGDPNSDFARNLGTAAGEIQLTNIGSGANQTNAGFSAHGANRSVVLNGGATLTWGSGFFLSGGTGTPNRHFILSADNSDGADYTLEFKNPINLNGAIRTVVARNGNAAIDAKLSGPLGGTGISGLLKDNPGTLELSAANTYAGTTTIFAGVLLLTNPTSIPGGITETNTNTILFTSTNENNIGVIGLGGLGPNDFTSQLSTGSGLGLVNLGTTAGFAAYGLNRAVNFKSGGVTQSVTWGTGGFVTGALGMSAVGADATVDLQNPIDLNGGARKVKVLNGTADIDGVLSGAITGTGSLTKDGGGTLSLTAFTAPNTYDGGTTIILGRLLVNNTTGSGTGSGPVTVTAGTLGGTGIIKPGTTAGTPRVTIASGSILSPGASIGTLTLDGATTTDTMLSLASGATIFEELNNSFLSDQVALIGGAASDIAFNNNTINFSDLSGGALAAGDYTLFTADVAGAYSGLTTDGNGNITAGLTIGTGLSAYTTSSLLQVGNNIVLNIGVTGDWNGDTKVNAADYVTWRKDPTGHGGDPNGYATWRENFSQSAAAGEFLAGQAVPEPATIALLVLAIPLVGSRKLRWARV